MEMDDTGQGCPTQGKGARRRARVLDAGRGAYPISIPPPAFFASFMSDLAYVSSISALMGVTRHEGDEP